MNSFRSANLRLQLFFAGVKFPDVNGNFRPEWQTLGFSTGDATIEATIESAELGYGIPIATLDTLVKKLDYTLTLNLREGNIEKLSYLNWEQPIDSANTPLTVVNTNITVSNTNFTTNYPSYFDPQGRPICFLHPSFPSSPVQNKISVRMIPSQDRLRMIPQNFQVLDGSGNDITNQYELREYGGIFYVVFIGAGNNDAATIVVSEITQRSYKSMVLFADNTKVGLDYRLLLIGRNKAGNNAVLTSLYIPRAKLVKPALPTFTSEDYLNLEIQFKPVISFPEGVYPTDPVGALRLLEIREWEPAVNTADILNNYS